jgi:predicted  nucleic acid-binding Zn-ribbon protein
MDFAALFRVVQSWGPSAISSCLVVVTLYLIKKVDENSKEDAKRAKVFQDQLEAKVGELHNAIRKELEAHGKRLSYIEMEYTKNSVFYEQLSGWRTEVNRLADKTDGHHAQIVQYILDLLNRGGT